MAEGNKWTKQYKYQLLGPAESFTNKEVSFTLQSTDADGRPSEIDINVISAKIHGAETVTPEIRDAHLGSYTITFEPKKVGVYNIDVSVGGKLFFQEKMKTMPTDNPIPDPLRFACEGPGVKGAKAGQDATFILNVTDKKNSTPTDIDLKDCLVSLEGHAKVPCKLVTVSKGKYRVSYNAPKKGTFTLSIVYQGKTVLKDTTTVVIVGAVDPAKTVAELNKQNPKAGEKVSIKIFAKDSDGEQVSIGGETFDVELAGPVLTEPEILDFSNGTYRVDALLPKAGRYECDIKLHDTHISNSPVKFKAE